VGREDGFMLPAKAVSDLPGKPAQDFSLRIDEEPVAIDGILFGHKCTHGHTTLIKFERVRIGESAFFVKRKKGEIGMLEDWSNGMMGYLLFSMISHYSTVPFFHQSFFIRREAA
jgi:hypothetical protein